MVHAWVRKCDWGYFLLTRGRPCRCVALEPVDALMVPYAAIGEMSVQAPDLARRFFQALAAMMHTVAGSNPWSTTTGTARRGIPRPCHPCSSRRYVGSSNRRRGWRRIWGAVTGSILRRDLATAFDTLVSLTDSLFPAVSGAMPAQDNPACRLAN